VYFEFEENWGDREGVGGFCGDATVVAVAHMSQVALRGQVCPPLLVVVEKKHECAWSCWYVGSQGPRGVVGGRNPVEGTSRT